MGQPGIAFSLVPSAPCCIVGIRDGILRPFLLRPSGTHVARAAESLSLAFKISRRASAGRHPILTFRWIRTGARIVARRSWERGHPARFGSGMRAGCPRSQETALTVTALEVP